MNTKRWFTLIEMLIVIVIVGILAAALIPRLVGVQERARDTARKADLNQVGSAISTYELDNGKLPTTADATDPKPLSLDLIKEALAPYLKSVPKDPKNLTIVWCEGSAWQYYFTPIVKNSNPNGSFAIIAAVEQAGAANFISDGTCLGTESTYEDIQSRLCEKVTETAENENCQYTPGEWQLQYVYLP